MGPPDAEVHSREQGFEEDSEEGTLQGAPPA